MGFKKPIVAEIAFHTFAINEFGMAACFLLWGTERGILIDTGCGMYNIREIADELCPVPYDVILTHSHGDHVAGIDHWDQVYIHPADMEALSPERFEQNAKMLGRYPEMMAAFGSFDAYEITPEQIHYPERVPELLPLYDGQIIELGNRPVTVVHMPGHTPGEIALIDPFSRIAFTGDACNVNLGLRACTIKEALEGMERLESHRHEFDRNYNGHIGYGSDNVNRSMPESCLDDCLHILRGILDGTADVQHGPSPFRGGDPVDYVKEGAVLITFDPKKIR